MERYPLCGLHCCPALTFYSSFDVDRKNYNDLAAGAGPDFVELLKKIPAPETRCGLFIILIMKYEYFLTGAATAARALFGLRHAGRDIESFPIWRNYIIYRNRLYLLKKLFFNHESNVSGIKRFIAVS